MISFVAIGESGTGKSTIGNFLLGGRPEGPFKSFPGVSSGTMVATTRSNADGLSFTETPGIPDLRPFNTKLYYNACIDVLKKEHSAIIFVFKYGKIAEEMLRTSKLLFREMNKANCIKFLIINDHHNYVDGHPPDRSMYILFANEIKRYTQVDFLLVFDVTSLKAMKERIEFMVEVTMQVPKPQSSPKLKSFDELSKWVASLKNDADYLREAVVEHDAAIERAEQEKDVLWDKPFFYDFLGSPVQSLILDIQSDHNAPQLEISRRDEKVLEKAMDDLREAANSFEHLQQAVEA
jgi:hypothetical protein